MPFAIIIIGASGVIAQIVLIRELLVIFQGNELSIGLILGNWLVAEALGSFLFRKLKVSLKYYKITILAFAIILPILCIVTRLLRPILGVLPSEIISFPIMFISSMIILLPASFLHGALFTSTVSVLTQTWSRSERKIPGYVYVLENLGTILGGIVMSFLLIPYLNTLQIAFVLGIINILAIIILDKFKYSTTQFFCYLIIVLFGFLLHQSSQIEHWTLKETFPKYNIISSTNTIYSNVTVINREEQYTFLVDGIPIIITPYPDQGFIEDFVNFPLLTHPNPQKILLISGGAGGVLTQMLKYNLDEIYYVELDPFLIQTVRKFSTPLIIKEFSDSRVKVINTDARLFLEKDTSQYDLIFITFLAPLSLQVNRFFTKEFFAICNDRLNPAGMLVTISPGSLSYISPTLRNLINSHLNTLAAVFSKTLLIPGNFNLYLSYKGKPLIDLTADTLYQRLGQRNITTSLFSLGYIQYRTQSYFIDWLNRSLQSKGTIKFSLMNQDGIPRGLFYNLFYKNTIVNPSIQQLFLFIQKINFKTITLILLAVLLILLLIRRKRLCKKSVDSRPSAVSSLFVIFTTGIIAMIFSLVLSLGFQIRYGYLYYQISILITTFIAGSALGGYIGNLSLFGKRAYLLLSEILIFILLLLLLISLNNQAYPQVFGSQIDFYIFLFTAGFLIGLQFPIANKICYGGKSGITSIVGELYAADLLGGFIGAITISVVLIPIIGIQQTLVAALFLKFISALLISEIL